MKFGATLSRRSVPQWRTHDLDYDEIKNLIKVQTSSAEGCSIQFENNLLAVLDSELVRIDEFVRCKAGEVERRLAACQRTVKNLTGEQGGNKQSSLKRFFKIEAEIDRVSKDAQSLSRFVNTQYTGFQKILKKHNKWCRLPRDSPSPLAQFSSHTELQHPFHRRANFQLILQQLSALYNVRQDSEQPTSNGHISESDIEQHPSQSSVTYWIHNDNLVETELFLLKHLTLRVPSSSPVSSGSVQFSSRTAYFDTDSWDIYQSMVPETANSSVRMNPPHLSWEENSSKKEVMIVVPSERKPLPIKRKDVSKFLASSADIGSPSEEWPSSQQHIHDYFRSLHPTIKVTAERTEFVKVSRNSSTPMTSNVSATMDRNILSSRLPAPQLSNIYDELMTVSEENKTSFPHAVLQIRWDNDSPRWLEELNGSHLIERVNNFSIYTHAVATLTTQSKLPYWMPLLQKDIRKLQAPLPRTVRRRDSASPYVTDSAKTSSSLENRASETNPTSAPATPNASIRKNVTRGGYGSLRVPVSPVVYWSEFETPDEEPYTVTVGESAPLLPWLRRKSVPPRQDLEAQHRHEQQRQEGVSSGFVAKAFWKIYGVVETSADGLTTLFMEKEPGERDIETTEDEFHSDDSSSIAPSEQLLSRRQHRQLSVDNTSRSQLLVKGYSLCVAGSTILLCLFGLISLLFNGEATGVAFILVGFLIAMTLEIVSLVRFIMQGGHHGVAWIGFLVVGLTGAAFVRLVALTESV